MPGGVAGVPPTMEAPYADRLFEPLRLPHHVKSSKKSRPGNSHDQALHRQQKLFFVVHVALGAAAPCKGRGVCPSWNTRRMLETAAHLTDHVFSRLPARQWVLSVPRRLRYHMQRDGATLNMLLQIFLRVIAQMLHASSPGAANADKQALHISAVAFIHRFGSSLNEHVHFHVCAVDGVFEEVTGEGGDVDADAQARDQAHSPRVIFHPATGVNVDAVDQVQTTLRRRIRLWRWHSAQRCNRRRPSRPAPMQARAH